jgi:polyisoprenoid-binding protein YceI
MRGLSLLAAAGLACWSPAAEAAPARYTIDPEHTSIAFMVSHIGYHNLLGQFLTGGGTFVWDEEGRALSDLEVRIDAASVFTRHQARDEHVRSKDFLDAAAHPPVTRPIRSPVGSARRPTKVTGPVTLDVTWNKSGWYPYLDNYVVGISARTVLRRSEWGMDYAVANGLVGDEVSVIIELEAIREKLPGQEPPPR